MSVAVGLVCAGPAPAALPERGGAYWDTRPGHSKGILYVDARRINDDSEFPYRCAGRWRLAVVGAGFQEPMGSRIGRDGRFSVRKRGNGVLLSARGRFRSRDVVALKYSISRRKPPRCEYHRSVTLYLWGHQFENCRTHRARDVVRSDRGRVFTYPRDLDANVYGCLFSRNKRFRFFSGGEYELATVAPRLAGPFAAYQTWDLQECCSDLNWRVEVFDLRSGRVRRVTPAPSARWNPTAGLPDTAATDLELKDSGAVAWIAYDIDRTPAFIPEVVALDALGTRSLDSGYAIEPNSLTLNGSTLSWRNGNGVRSATLE